MLPVILDLDLAYDSDDIVDLYLTNVLADERRCRLLAVICSTENNVPAAPMARACLDFFSRQAVPVGQYKNTYPSMHPTDNYAAATRTQFRPGDTDANYASDISVYRTALAASAGGVVILAVGPAVSLRGLMNSAADGGGTPSPLTGMELIAAKVSALVWVAGVWPTDSGAPEGFTPEYNMIADPAASNDVVNNWPTPIVFPGVEMAGLTSTGTHSAQPAGTVVAGFGRAAHGDASTNPFHYAWDQCDAVQNPSWLDVNGMRNAWGNMGVLYALGGVPTDHLFTVAGANGTATVNSTTGHNSWSASAGTRSYLGKTQPDMAFQAAFLQYANRPPRPPTSLFARSRKV